ncbi:MAG: hypothetical protein SGJ18_16450 [Pseudomonadota bacterium]|nr:hypothetical protein [Pseudomonadota bacterium]
MLVWAGYSAGAGFNLVGNYFGAFNPVTKLWRKIDIANPFLTTTLQYSIAISTDASWATFTGTKFLWQGSVSVARGFDGSAPRAIGVDQTTWTTLPQGLLPTVNFDARTGDRRAVYDGRNLFIFVNGVSGFKYSFP